MRVEQIIADGGIPVREREVRVAEWFAARPDLGAGEAADLLAGSTDDLVAHYVAGYLSRVPGHEAVKRDSLAHLAAGPAERARAAAWLVQFARPDQLAPIVERFLREEPATGSPLYSPVYEIALYFPDFLRAYRQQLPFDALRRAMLSGAPDSWADAYIAAYAKTKDPAHLESLARFHTPYAALALLCLDIAPGHGELREIQVEQAGLLADGSGPSFVRPTFRGVVGTDSPHRMGGAIDADVPACPACATPAGHVLTLAAAALPYGLAANPTFLWYECECDRRDTVTVRVTASGIEALDSPATRAAATANATRLVPGERALVLEPHPNQTGTSLPATGRSGLHQVGGIPRWSTPRPLPRCPQCRAKMPVLATISDGMTAYGRLAFLGTLYGYWCDRCAIAVTERG